LAAIASVQFSIEEPIYSFQVNVQGMLHVLQAIRQARRNIRLVYASSAAVYGDALELPCRDDTPLSGLPISPYALHKFQDEEYAHLYEKLFGVKSLGLRYFNVYGSRQDPASPYSGVISRFMSAYKNDAELTVFGDGSQSRDFVHVSDIAAANWLALKSDYVGVANIATGQSESLLQLIDYMSQAGGRPAKTRFEPARQGDIKASYGATKTAHAHIGFQYSVSLQEGVKRMIEMP
jgi:nucleoside-diphosphate-sugar epimerase